MNKKQNTRSKIFLVAALALLAAVPLPATPLPHDELIFDQAHSTGYIDWSGSVGYVNFYHRDWSYLPPEEGGGVCTGGCTEQVTQINSGGSVSGSFAWDVQTFEVMLAMERDGNVGSAVIRACGATNTVNLYGGGSVPGFNDYALSVPAGCRSWSVTASGGFVHIRRVYAAYTSSPPSPPTISGTFSCAQPGSDGWCVGNATLTLTASDPQGYPLTISGSLGNGTPISCNGSCNITLPEGQATATYTVTAATSGLSDSGSTAWRVDRTPPSLTASPTGTSGAGGWYVSIVQYAASASDALSGLASLQYNLDGTGWRTYSGPVSILDGMHTINFRAVDRAGNVVDIPRTLQVDTSPPSLAANVSGDSGAGGWYISDVEVEITAVDALSGLASLRYSLDGAPWQDYSAPRPLSDGRYVIDLQAQDLAGNVSNLSRSVNVDTVPPLLSDTLSGVNGLGGWYVSDVQVDLSASDTLSGLSQVRYRLDGAGWRDFSAPFTITDGIHALDLQALDVAGLSTTLSRTVNVDTVPPALALDLPVPDGLNGWYVTPVQVRASASDSGSGLARLEGTQNEGTSWEALPFELADGVTPLEVRAFDLAGNTSSESRVLHVDTSPPLSSYSSHTDGQTVSGPITIYGETSDLVSGPTAGEISLDGGVTWDELFTSGPNPAPWRVAWDTYTIPNGSYELLVRSVDEAGNQETPARLSLQVANPPPDVSLEPSSWSYGYTARVTVSPQGIPVGVVTFLIMDDGTVVRHFDLDPMLGEHAVNWDGLDETGEKMPSGKYPVTVVACDIFDNCADAHGEVRIPFLHVVLPPLPFISTATPTPTPIATATVTTMPTPAVTEVKETQPPRLTPSPTPMPAAPAPKPVEPTKPALPVVTWPRVVLGGLTLLYAIVLSLDPRPDALRALARVIKPTLED